MIEQINLDLQAGGTDSLGNKVIRVLAKEKDTAKNRHSVWEIEGGEIACDADNDAIAANPEVSTWTIQVRGLIRSRRAFGGKYNTNIGHAYKLCFDGNPEGAIGLLKQTYSQVSGRLIEESRLLYLLGALSVWFLSEIAFLCLYFLRPMSEFPHRVVAGLAMSALGGFLSVAGGLSKQAFEVPQRRLLVLIYGALRLGIALIAGVVAVLMITTGVALSFLQEHNELGGFLLACFLAGFSERLVPSSLRQIESATG